MDLGLAGKRALVTGSSSGLDEAIAGLLAREGAQVVVHGRDVDRARAVVDAIIADGGAATMAIGDLRSDEQAEGVAAAAIADGPVDILVNNAGAYHHVDWRSAGPRVWAKTYDTNVLSAVRMIERLVPTMRERRGGRVIQIGGGLASQPDCNASLAARHNLAVSLARDLRGRGVTSNVVSPGAILVPAVKAWRPSIARCSPFTTWSPKRGCSRPTASIALATSSSRIGRNAAASRLHARSADDDRCVLATTKQSCHAPAHPVGSVHALISVRRSAEALLIIGA